MRSTLIALAIASLPLLSTGCATSFRAGGPNRGIEAGAAVGPAPVYNLPSNYAPAETPAPLVR